MKMNLVEESNKMDLKLPSELELNSLEITDLFPYIIWHENRKYFDLPSGAEHYRLLAYMSSQLPKGQTILDVGTYLGMSAVALAYNRTCNVISFDLVNHFGNELVNPTHRSNISFKQENILEKLQEYLVNCSFIFLDTNHDGEFEHTFFEALVKYNFQGILILDDIHLNHAMESFWNSITLKKFDITPIGHWSGTGAVVFNEKFVNLVP